MFLGKNRFLNQGEAPAEGGSPGVGENTEFLNQAKNMSMGMQRFLAKKGINSTEDLANRAQFAPPKPFRKVR
ncbi:hypothetical protein [Desulfosporosinus sp. Sb-LF]|uniref:hypothetical protein n=1 Tax=Desulfosporosinus sp. Sb-LF TaxID=2560027 RepID=UPI00107F1871|nr:hypothetical protein [Desulfosporosinus sp. Sb-LF]TGE31179.1 hypothetical protein E4K68_18830 [Desulfosporosinus sp. Sb-LF]